MRIFLFVCIALVILALLVCLRIWYAKKKVKNTDVESKIRKLNAALEPFGFRYDEQNDGICARLYSWQREMGYCEAYDKAAFAMYMVFDCEPVYFNYNGARYLLEIWKGQYGCTTGAEIGLYVNREGDFEKNPEELFYESVEDEECLPMTYTLYKNGERIQARREVHWWLSGFNVGMFSDKTELVMEVGITFPNYQMCNAFCEGMLRRGYGRNAIYVEQTKVYFVFGTPLSPQPDTCSKWCVKRVMRRNRKNCKLYSIVSNSFDTTLDRITYIGYCFPLLYRTLVRMGMKTGERKLRKLRKVRR